MGGDYYLDPALKCLCPGLRLRSGHDRSGADSGSAERTGVEHSHALGYHFVSIFMCGFLEDGCDGDKLWNTTSHHPARRSRIGAALSFAPGDWLGIAAKCICT